MKALRTLSTPIYVTVLFVICFVTLIATAFSSYENLQKLKLHNEWMEHTWSVKDHLKNINLLLMDAESGMRGYFMSDNPAFLGPLKTAKAKLPAEFEILERAVRDNPPQQEKLKQLRALFDEKMQRFDQGIAVYKDGGLKDIINIIKLGEGKEIMDEVRFLDIVMEKEELDRLAERRAEFYNEYNRSLWISISINAIATLILMLFYRMIQENFRRRKIIEDELKQSNDNLESTVLKRTEQLATLSRHLLKVSEEEKRQLARELHDEMGSNLTAISMDLSIAIQRIKKIDPALAEQLLRAKATLLETVNLKRRLIEDMRPSMLDHLGLAASIRHHCERMASISGLTVELEMDDDFDYIDPTLAIAIFRIAQESLNNAIKYAKATTVKVTFRKRADGYLLCVSDDGVGLPEGALTKPKSHGILGMRERALLLGGVFTVISGRDHVGTTIEAHIPFTEPNVQ
jgi:signal transduction histidine kinase